MNTNTIFYTLIFFVLGVSAYEFSVFPTVSDMRVIPSTTLLGDGKFVVVWANHTSSYVTIQFALYNVNGTQFGNNIIVPDIYQQSTIFSYEVVKISQDKFLVMFSTADASINTYVLVGRMYFNNGTLFDTFIMNDNSLPRYYYSSSVTLRDSLIISFQSKGAFNAVYLRTYNITSRVFGSVQKISNSPTYCSDNKIIYLSNGNILVTWNNAYNSSCYSLTGQIFTTSLVKVGNVIVFGNATKCSQRLPSTSSTNGLFVIAWHAITNTHDNIFAEIYDNSGNVLKHEFSMKNDSQINYVYPSVICSENNFTVVFIKTSDVVYRTFDFDGHPITVERIINNFKKYYHVPVISRDQSGKNFVVWGSISVIGNRFGVNASFFSDHLIIDRNSFHVNNGGSVVISSNDIFSLAGQYYHDIIFNVSGLEFCDFRINNVSATSFSSSDIRDGLVTFCHTHIDEVPSYILAASFGGETVYGISNIILDNYTYPARSSSSSVYSSNYVSDSEHAYPAMAATGTPSWIIAVAVVVPASSIIVLIIAVVTFIFILKKYNMKIYPVLVNCIGFV